MKKTILLLISFQLLAISFLVAQTIRRCNNNPGVTGANVYATIQAAHDAAAAGDIIYVEPSTATYGNLRIIKMLTIIGNGYYNDKNSNAAFDSRTSIVGFVTFDAGSSSSVVMGIDFSSSGTSLLINDINITVTRCRNVGNISFSRSSNLVPILDVYTRGNNAIITKNIIMGQISGNNAGNEASQYGYNCIITNNIFGSGNINNLTNSLFSNNVVTSELSNLYGCSISNNIFDARRRSSSIQYVSGSNVGNYIFNNICLGQSATTGGNGNVNFGDPLNTFMVADPWPTIALQDAQFQLKAGSPAIGIGIVGGGVTDAGAFGGVSPYVLSGLPPVPIITNFTMSGVGNSNTPLKVNITVRGNN